MKKAELKHLVKTLIDVNKSLHQVLKIKSKDYKTGNEILNAIIKKKENEISKMGEEYDALMKAYNMKDKALKDLQSSEVISYSKETTKSIIQTNLKSIIEKSFRDTPKEERFILFYGAKFTINEFLNLILNINEKENQE